MGDVLVYIEPLAKDDGARMLAFARPLADALGGDLVALVVGEGSGAVAIGVADVVLEIVHPALISYVPEAHQHVVLAAIASRSPSLVLFENTTVGIDLAAWAAAASNLPLVSYCVALASDGTQMTTTSEIYGGQLLASALTTLPAVVAMNSGALPDEPASLGRGERATLAPPVALDHLRTTFVETRLPADTGIDITKAQLLVCVGRGIGGADNLSTAEDLAAALGAEIAASRPVVDSGWLPKARQVGKSGLTVKPRLYLTLGVSGAPEHQEGMRDSELIIAVNKDPGAAIFNIAHYGAVADLFDVAEALTELLAT